MKNLYIALLAMVGLCCNQVTEAQPTWTVGSTTLTELDLVTGIQLPWEILWGPDDQIWCTTRPGLVLRIDPETGSFTTILNITSQIFGGGSSEPGLLGMALHPDFENNPNVYLVYVYSAGVSPKERLSMFTWNGSQLVDEQVLIDEIPAAYIHDGSRLLITPDNKLLMTTGDTGNGGAVSQQIGALNGKTLRINLDGSIPDDNPDPESYVWSWGHRNGQGLCVGPTGIIYESEHGQNNSDELNIIEMGRNYGWPTVEGMCNTANEITFCEANNVMEPLKEWSPCVAVNGLGYYNHPAIPEWQNSLIMGVMGGLGGTNGSNDRVSVLHLSEDGLTVTSEDKYFTSLNQRFRDVCFNPTTGAVYVALNGSSYPGQGPNKIKEFVNLAYGNNQVANASSSQEVTLYPNPAKDSIQLDLSSSFLGSTILVYSNNGKLQMEVPVENAKMQLDVHSLGRGNYWLSVTSPQGTVTRAFQLN